MKHTFMQLAVIRRNWHVVLPSLIVMGAMALLAFFFQHSGEALMEERLKDKMKSLAAVAATIFSAEDLRELRGERDYLKPQWQKW